MLCALNACCKFDGKICICVTVELVMRDNRSPNAIALVLNYINQEF